MISPRKILAIKVRSLGDTVLMTAALGELRRAFPQAQVHALVNEDWSSVLDGHPAVDRVWSTKKLNFWRLCLLAMRLRCERYDCVINFHASSSSALLARLLGAKNRSIHFHGHTDSNRFSTVTIPGKGQLKPIVERDMDAVRAFGISVPSGVMPRLFLNQENKPQAIQPLLVVGLGASRPTKSWPVQNYAELAMKWCERVQGSVVAVASPMEAALCAEFLKATHAFCDRISAVHSLSVRQMMGMISSAAVFVGNDSGPKHVAVALGVPTCTLFGPEHPFEWHPYPCDLHPYFFVEGLSCRRHSLPGMPAWCGLRDCDHENQCMKQIQVEDVLKECIRMRQK